MTPFVFLAIGGIFAIGTVQGFPTMDIVPILIPTSGPPVLESTEGMADDLDTIVVEAGETTTFQPPESFQPFDPNDCFLPQERGPCRALLDAYFFNTTTTSCEFFSWSGCGGNANRFRSLETCRTQCNQTKSDSITPVQANETVETNRETVPTTEPVVVKPKPTLPTCPKFNGCGAQCVIIQDRTDRGCKKCLCGDRTGSERMDLPGPVVISSGNITVSKTSQVSVGSVSGTPKDEIDEPIAGNASENCKLPTKRGTCRGMMTRYHYDPSLKDCVIFHYGGCDGNLNNFVTKEKCIEYCQGQ